MITPAVPLPSATAPASLIESFQLLRTEGVGEELILDQNLFIEQALPGDIVRELSEMEMGVYRVPYLNRESRKPLLVWPRQVPIDGEPADVVKRVDAYNEWLLHSNLPKLHIYVSPGVLNPPETVAFLQKHMANYEAIHTGHGLHFFQEDHPEAIGRNISDWYCRIHK